jgi:hypothetical protein
VNVPEEIQRVLKVTLMDKYNSHRGIKRDQILLQGKANTRHIVCGDLPQADGMNAGCVESAT